MHQETFNIQFEDGPRAGESFPMGDSVTTLGRSSECTIVVNDASVSRKHLVFYVEDHGVSVEDAGSSHGSQINGQPLTGRVTLSHADRLKVGDLHIRLASLSETLNLSNRMDIFNQPEEIEEKFNSESELKVHNIVKPTPTAPAHLDSMDEITGVFDFSEISASSGSGANPQLNVNDGTVPLLVPEQKSQMPIIIILCVVIALLAGVLIYAMVFHGKDSPVVPEAVPAAPSAEPAFIAPETSTE